MRFADIHTDKHLIEVITRMCDEGRIPHALLFHENQGGGGLAAALAFVQYIACPNRSDGDSCGVCPTCNRITKLIHPDLHFVFPVANPQKPTKDKVTSLYYLQQWRDVVLENPYFDEEFLNKKLGIEEKVGLIKVDEAKSILEILNKSSYEGGNKYMIIWLPERMNIEAANKLLKILEEPFPGTIFLLISQAPERIISTIRSRTLQLRIHPMGLQEIEKILTEELQISQDDANYYALLSQGSYGKALECYNNAEIDNNSDLYMVNDLIKVLKSKRLSEAFPIVNELSTLGRENQRRFCIYAQEYLRKLYMLKSGHIDISYANRDEMRVLTETAEGLPEKFFQRAFNAFEKALTMIGSNVNSKILFTSLINRLYVSI